MTTISSELWRAMDRAAARRAPEPRNLDALWQRAGGVVAALRTRTARFMRTARVARHHASTLQHLSEADFAAQVLHARALVRAQRDRPGDAPLLAALAGEAVRRTLGLTLHTEQYAGGLALLAGCIAEMATGEGKTVTAVIPAAIAGWRGRGCHVITVNSYLAQRDAASLTPAFALLGLRCAALGERDAPAARRAAYAADVTYCTNKDAAADFLRDRLLLGTARHAAEWIARGFGADRAHDHGDRAPVMRGLEFAIIDEADSVLIDEAVTPLILSGGDGRGGTPDEASHELASCARAAHTMAAGAVEGEHYTLDRRRREVRLTERGRALAAARAHELPEAWSTAERAREWLIRAITARDLFVRDVNYVLRDGKVVIVDDFTGRTMPDRTWREGLQQAIEAKEGLAATPARRTLARISFQKFFARYAHLCGMSGTARECGGELWMAYRTPTVVIPTHRPGARTVLPVRALPDREAKRLAVVHEAAQMHARGRPVLIGVRRISESEAISALLRAHGLAHEVLNAVRHEDEARIIARAGARGAITIATNMAGRGTDIRPEPGVIEPGGLHVIVAEVNESARIDRQLFGRAARQGDPGSAQVLVCPEDEPLNASPWWRRACTMGDAGAAWAIAVAQRASTRRGVLMRRAVSRGDRWLEESLGFAE